MILDRPLAHIKCLTDACDRQGVLYKIHDLHGNVVEILLKKPVFFSNFTTPFNNASTITICDDKEFSYFLLGNKVRMPKTRGFLNPEAKDEYRKYKKHRDLAEIKNGIIKDFTLPVVVKMNRGLRGVNVFLCRREEDILRSLKTIFDKKSPFYDYIALVQEYIEPVREYRAVVFNSELVLLYQKDITNAEFDGNLSPLHFKNAKAVQVVDGETLSQVSRAIEPIFSTLNLEFGGVDIIEDKEGKLNIIELNATPGFSIFLRDNDRAILIDVYEKLIKYLVNKYERQ